MNSQSLIFLSLRRGQRGRCCSLSGAKAERGRHAGWVQAFGLRLGKVWGPYSTCFLWRYEDYNGIKGSKNHKYVQTYPYQGVVFRANPKGPGT